MFGPNNERLIVSTEGGSLLSYDVASGECVDERCDVEMEIPDITFSSDQMLFIAAVSPVSCKVDYFFRAAPLPAAAHAASPQYTQLPSEDTTLVHTATDESMLWIDVTVPEW